MIHQLPSQSHVHVCMNFHSYKLVFKESEVVLFIFVNRISHLTRATRKKEKKENYIQGPLSPCQINHLSLKMFTPMNQFSFLVHFCYNFVYMIIEYYGIKNVSSHNITVRPSLITRTQPFIKNQKRSCYRC